MKLLVPALVLLAACSGTAAPRAQDPISKASGAPAPDDQADEMKKKGVDPDTRAKETFLTEAERLTKISGELDTADVLVTPRDKGSKALFTQFMLDPEWILVKKEPTEEGGTLFRFIRPKKMRIDTPTDGRKPGVVNPPK